MRTEFDSDEQNGAGGAAGGRVRLKVLSVVKLWPNVLSPQQGSLTERRLRLLHDLGDTHVRVVAAIPTNQERARGVRLQVFAPGQSASAVPEMEKRASIVVHHPHYWDAGAAMERTRSFDGLGGVGHVLSRRLYRNAVARQVRKLWDRFGPFDLIDAHGVGLDGWTARSLSRSLGAPFMATAYASAGRLSEAARAPLLSVLEDAALTLVQGERQEAAIRELAGDKARIAKMRPGVDLERYRPEHDAAGRAALKQQFGAPPDRPMIVATLGADPVQSGRVALGALASAADHGPCLRILSAGAAEDDLQREATRRGLGDRIGFLDGPSDAAAAAIRRAADAAMVLGDGPEARASALEMLASGAPTAINGDAELLGVGQGPHISIVNGGAGPAAAVEWAAAITSCCASGGDPDSGAREAARRAAQAHPLRHSVEDLAAAMRMAAQADIADTTLTSPAAAGALTPPTAGE
ncbi:MAG: hypothetical protein AAF909_09905 [Pseudomonadota bacterium]